MVLTHGKDGMARAKVELRTYLSHDTRIEGTIASHSKKHIILQFVFGVFYSQVACV